MDKNIYAAIAMALYEYQGNNVHDKEPGFKIGRASCRERV